MFKATNIYVTTNTGSQYLFVHVDEDVYISFCDVSDKRYKLCYCEPIIAVGHELRVIYLSEDDVAPLCEIQLAPITEIIVKF